MVIKPIDGDFSVCKTDGSDGIDLTREFTFVAKTDEELSLVCKTSDVPPNTIEREDGRRAFRIEGVLDFSLVGILSKISSLLADGGISIFAVSTYNTDYILTKKEDFDAALAILQKNGFTIAR